MVSEQDMEQRLAKLEGGKKKKRKGISLPMAALMIAGTLAGMAGLVALNAQKDQRPTLGTSDVRDFQSDGSNGGRLVFDTIVPAKNVEEAIIRIEQVLTPKTVTETVVAENPALAEELAAMRQQLAESNAARDQAISDAVTGLKDAFEERSAELEEAAKKAQADLTALENTSKVRQSSLQTLLDRETARREAMELEIARQELNSAEAARLEQAALDAATLEKAQITSPALVYASGQSSTALSSNATNSSGQSYNQSENEQFMQNAPALVVSEAEQMQEPHKTLAQGSVVQAVLQVAINSDLPGNVVAVISEPVTAYSGDRILIPRGSRLFGS